MILTKVCANDSLNYQMNKKSVNKLLPIVLISAFFLSLFVVFSTRNLNYRKDVLSESDQNVSNEKGQDNKDNETEKVEKLDSKETSEANDQEKEVEVKDGESKTRIRIHEGDTIEFEQEGLKVQVQNNNLISVNPKTKELTVKTPAGEKTVTTLPDQAVQNLVDSENFSVENKIDLATNEKGDLVYNVDGVKYERFLGIFKVAINKRAQVSAQDGKVVDVAQSFLSKLLDLLSF